MSIGTKVNWLISDNTITVNFNGQTHMLSKHDAYAPKLMEALKQKKFDEIPSLVSAALRIEKFSDGKFQVKNGEILVDGIVASPVLGRKIKEFADEGLPYEPLVEFAKKVAKNPSARATQELYQFLEKNNHPITDSGNFIAYKKVREDFKDVHSGTFDNSPGNTLKMPRSMVNEDPNQTCSAGLHVANFDYASRFYPGGIMLEIEVNPEHVVAIPIDYNQAKMRVCEYKVLSVIEQELSTPLRITQPEASETPSSDCESSEECECEAFCSCCDDCDCNNELCSSCEDCLDHCQCDVEEEEYEEEEEEEEYDEEDENEEDFPRDW